MKIPRSSERDGRGILGSRIYAYALVKRRSEAGTERRYEIAVAEAIIYTGYVDPELILTKVFQRISGLFTWIAV